MDLRVTRGHVVVSCTLKEALSLFSVFFFFLLQKKIFLITNVGPTVLIIIIIIIHNCYYDYINNPCCHFLPLEVFDSGK